MLICKAWMKCIPTQSFNRYYLWHFFNKFYHFPSLIKYNPTPSKRIGSRWHENKKMAQKRNKNFTTWSDHQKPFIVLINFFYFYFMNTLKLSHIIFRLLFLIEQNSLKYKVHLLTHAKKTVLSIELGFVTFS